MDVTAVRFRASSGPHPPAALGADVLVGMVSLLLELEQELTSPGRCLLARKADANAGASAAEGMGTAAAVAGGTGAVFITRACWVVGEEGPSCKCYISRGAPYEVFQVGAGG
jgi:hypothetical protein